MLDSLKRDAGRYAELGGWWRQLGFWVGATFRFGTWAHSVRNPLLRLPLVMLYRVVKVPWRLFLNIILPAGATGVRIGPGLCLIHPSNILIGHGTVIGEDCLIFHEVTLGHGAEPGMPIIGDRVDLYVGARVLGGVRIGDDVQVGANCVVTRSVPPRSVVLQAPSRVVPLALLARMAPPAREGSPVQAAPTGPGSPQPDERDLSAVASEAAGNPISPVSR